MLRGHLSLSWSTLPTVPLAKGPHTSRGCLFSASFREPALEPPPQPGPPAPLRGSSEGLHTESDPSKSTRASKSF